jgi:membrane protease YdiL (CAAX protease family)
VGWIWKSWAGWHHPERDFFRLFFWALAQQFIVQTVIFRELERRLSRGPAVVGAAAVFGLLHLPNPFLVAMTFLGGCMWCWSYSHRPNLIPLALSHSLTSLMIIACLSKSLTGSMSVGFAYFL